MIVVEGVEIASSGESGKPWGKFGTRGNSNQREGCGEMHFREIKERTRP